MKLFQINEDDLAELERSVPELCRILCDVIVNVRWDYGPPSEVFTIPADEPPKQGD